LASDPDVQAFGQFRADQARSCADDPTVHLAAALRRQRHVLDGLVHTNVLSPAQTNIAALKMAQAAHRFRFHIDAS
jgi:hypothetical protein